MKVAGACAACVLVTLYCHFHGYPRHYAALMSLMAGLVLLSLTESRRGE